MGQHSDFRISSFHEADSWRILMFKWKTERYFGQITNLNMTFHIVVSVYRLV